MACGMAGVAGSFVLCTSLSSSLSSIESFCLIYVSYLDWDRRHLLFSIILIGCIF